MKYVAFLRNVNLGQPKSPTRAQLESAFVSAGAHSAQSFQTNGTLVFEEADSEEVAWRIAEHAMTALRDICGVNQPAYVTSLQHLADLVENDPFGGIQAQYSTQFNASFMPLEAIAKIKAWLTLPRGEVEVVRITDHVVLSVSHYVQAGRGHATPFFENLLAVPVTTRGWDTILRLVRKHSGLRNTR